MNLDWGGSNYKRRNAYGWKKRMSTKRGRKIIAKRRAKGRWELVPGERCRNKSPSDKYTFYPQEGKGWKSRDCNNLYANGFRVDAESNGGIKPLEGWEWYMGQIQYMINVKHGLVPFHDRYMGIRYYLTEATAESEKAAAEEFERFKVKLEYFDPNDYSHTY